MKITRETYKLIGAVHKIECEFATFEIVDGNPIETRHQSAGYSIFDLEGKLTEEVSPYRLMMYDAYKDKYFYDKKNEISYREEYDENELLIGKTVFEKLPDGNRIEKHYYFNNQGKITLGSHTVFEGDNDDKDFIIEMAHYDENENIIPHHFHKYNQNEKSKKNKVFTANGFTIEEFRNNENKELTDKYITSYDLKGNRTEFSCFDANGKLTLKDEYHYEFDSIRNWTQETQNHWVIGWGEFKLVPLSMTRRKIDYYHET